MATTIAFKVEVDSGKSVKDLTEVEKQLEGVNEKVSSGNVGFRESAKLIKEYQDIALKAGRESPVGQEAIRRAAQLKDQLGDLRNEVTRLSKDGQALQGALALGETVTAGYGAFQGVIALVGDENEKLLETIAKLQAAQSILTGIEKIRLSLEKESVLMLQARVLWTKAVTLAQGGLTKALGVSTAAARGFAAALAATGIGAIVVGLGLLIANFNKVIGLVKDGIKWFDGLGSTVKNVISVIFPIIGLFRMIRYALEELGIIDSAETKALIANSEARAQALRNEADAARGLTDAVDAEYKRRLALLKAAGKDTAAEENAMLTERLSNLQIEQQAVVDWVNSQLSLGRELTEAEQERVAESRKRLVELADLIRATNTDIEVQQISHQTRMKNNAAKAALEAKAAQDKADKEKADADQKEFERVEGLMNATRDLMVANIEDTAIRRAAQLEIQQAKEREDLIAKYGADTELMALLEVNQFNEMEALKAELQAESEAKAEQKRAEDLQKAQERFERELELMDYDWQQREQRERENLDNLLAAQLISQEDYEHQVALLNQRALTEQQKVNQAKIALGRELASNMSAMAGAAASLAKEGSKEQKALIGIQIAIDTASGIASAVSRGMELGWPLALVAIPAGIAAVLSGIANAKKALSSAGGSVPGGSVRTPSFGSMNSSVAAPAMNQTSAGGIGTSTEGAVQQQQQMQVVVLASEVSDVNQQNASIELASVF